jgi:hypothetical protein
MGRLHFLSLISSKQRERMRSFVRCVSRDCAGYLARVPEHTRSAGHVTVLFDMCSIRTERPEQEGAAGIMQKGFAVE